MEHGVDFSPLPDYVLITTKGRATVHGFADLLKELTESPEWIKNSPQLVDHRDLDLSHLMPSECTSHPLPSTGVRPICRSRANHPYINVSRHGVTQQPLLMFWGPQTLHRQGPRAFFPLPSPPWHISGN